MAYQKPDGFTGEPTVEYLTSERERDPFALMLGHIVVGVERARHAADMLAESYRRFDVGATGYVFNAETGETAAISAANMKLRLDEDEIDEHDVEDIPKFCAEMNVIATAEDMGFTRLLAIVVAATADPKKIAAVMYRRTRTLHPCEECRNVLYHSPLVGQGTQIMTVGSDENVFQSQSLKNLLRRYQQPLKKFRDPPAAPYVPYEWIERLQFYLRERDRLQLPNPADFRGDISRHRERVKLARAAMSTEFELEV